MLFLITEYDEDTVSLDRVEVWRKIIFFIFTTFFSFRLKFFSNFFHFLGPVSMEPALHILKNIFDFKIFHDCHSNLIKNTQVNITK